MRDSSKTRFWQVDATEPNSDSIREAAEILQMDGVVAFPTETVYGLGANAFSASAVQKIYEAKGRPSHNPLIVHIADASMLSELVTEWPAKAELLASHFWPGPLTMVLPKSARVPGNVTGNGPTIAVRMPAHPVALALLRACQLPLAAPSANRSNELSPTLAEHVRKGLSGRIDGIIDAGPTIAGIESTVLDLSRPIPTLLRPGPIPPQQLESWIGPIQRGPHKTEETPSEISEQTAPLPSPGMLAKHYSPQTPLISLSLDQAQRELHPRLQGLRLAWLWWKHLPTHSEVKIHEKLPDNPVDYAACLYNVLHRLDEQNWDRIVIELPPEGDDWLGIQDRLKRASQPLS